LTIKSKRNDENKFGTDYNSEEEIRKVFKKFEDYFDNCKKKTLSIMDVDSFISEKDNDSVFLNKKTKRNNPKTRKKHKLV
jgi:hypothetical protein